MNPFTSLGIAQILIVLATRIARLTVSNETRPTIIQSVQLQVGKRARRIVVTRARLSPHEIATYHVLHSLNQAARIK